MRIAIDLRSLQSGQVSGVENYTLNLLEHLLSLDRDNRYTLFYNSWKNARTGHLHFVNSQVRQTHVPNKLLNAGLKLGWTTVGKLAGDFDCLFLPNLNQYGQLRGKKLVLTVHDLSPVVTPEFYDIKRRLWHRFLGYRKAFTEADLIFAVSEHTKMDLIRLFQVPESKIRVVYPGIDHTLFTPEISLEKRRAARNRYSLPGEFILFLSTVEPRKNLQNLVRAFELVSHPAHLVVVGRPGWKNSAIFKQLRESSKSRKIHYLGYLEEQDKSAVISLAKAVAYPSFYEGFGFVPLEAAACGVPTVVSQFTSLPEVMGDAALLVNPYHIEGMAEGLTQALTDAGLRERLAAKGLERASVYRWERAAQGVLEGINSISKNK